MRLSDVPFDLNDPLVKLVAKRKCEKSFLFFIRYFFKLNRKETYTVLPFLLQIIGALEDVAHGRCQRLIINIPPRMGKTEIAVINFMAWVLANNPKAKFIHLSYADSLALDNSSKAKELVLSDEYQSFWPIKLKDDSRSKKKWYTSLGGGVYATAAGGQVTGFGAGDILASPFSGAIIIDDPLKAGDEDSDAKRNKVNERYYSTIMNRLNNERVPIIIIMQRLHEDDLTGYLLAREPEKWRHIKISGLDGNDRSIWEDRYSTTALHQLRVSSPRVFAGQFEQNPAPQDGNMFRESWLEWYINEGFDEIYQSWDTAIKTGENNDWSVCTTWGVKNGLFYLIDCFVERLEYPELVKAVKAQYIKHKPRQIVIEDKASGQQLLQSLRRETQLPIVAYDPTGKGDKVARFMKASVEFEARRVLFPNDADKRAMMQRIIIQLKTFPNSKNDDIVDSIANFLNWYKGNKKDYKIRVL